MAKRRGSWALWGVLLAVVLVAGKGQASTFQKGARLHPRTGRPIVQRSGVRLSSNEIRALVQARGFRDVEKAVSIALRESGGDAGIVLDTRGMTRDELLDYWKGSAREELSVGLWQVNLLANAALVPGETLDEKIRSLQDPGVSADVAFRLSEGGTAWGPWGG